MRTRLDKNILVISDLHLGEDLRATSGEEARQNGTGVSYLRRIARLEKELEAFLVHYTGHRLDERPWRLVVNGDMVDFMSVMILPPADAPPGSAGEADDEERIYGLQHGERQTVDKLRQVMARHRGIFLRLAEFVAAGNELVIVVGNHDAEFHYPEVQRHFVDGLTALSPSAARGSVRFCPWFYYEEQVLYVEHGHQYDEYCSFDYQLHPSLSSGNLALSVAHAGVRYFTNLVPEMDPHTAEAWTGVDYIKWVFGHGMGGIVRLAYLYGLMVWKLLAIWSALTDVKSDESRRLGHRAALKALSYEYRLSHEKLLALDGLHCAPVLKRFGRLLASMFIDRMLLGLSVVAGVVVAWNVAGGWTRALSIAGVIVGGVALNELLARGRMIPSPKALRRAPERIWKIVKAPFIVFGHSHLPERVALEGGGVYFNTGSWAEEDKAEHAFPHLIISGLDEPRAELHQWRNGMSAPF